MTLAETALERVRVFHGSTEPRLRLEAGPLYGVRDFGFAASYGLDRVAQPAFVHTMDFRFKHLCGMDELRQLLDKHGIDPWPSDAGVFISHPEFMGLLTEAGYDGLTGYDFGFRADFEEAQVWMVVDASAQVTILDCR